MNKDDLKKYSVIVNGGSGCLFQPMTDSYTYILTAKHLFFEKNEEGRGVEKVQYPDGTEIEVKRFIQTSEGWDEELIPFILIEGENYFPHKDENTDIAILKITPIIKGFDDICIIDDIELDGEFVLAGSPVPFRENPQGDRYTHYNIQSIITSANKSILAQVDPALNQNNIEGTSGGGVLKIDSNYILVAGIQSKMANGTNYQAGQIAFVPIKHFNEIVEYEENEGKLSKLYPPHLRKFDFLIDDCFTLEVDEIDEVKVSNARVTLRNKAYEITKSDITPIGIKDLFKERLLIDEKASSCLSHKALWISWLEFLVIMNLMKDENLNSDMLSDLFNSYRLKFLNIDDWTTSFRKTLRESDYIGLKEDSTVVVNTRCAPKTNRNLIIKKGNMPDIANVYDKRGFRTDRGIDPYTSFNFVHLDFFKSKCIIEKLDEYQDLNEIQLIEKIKIEYNELFN